MDNTNIGSITYTDEAVLRGRGGGDGVSRSPLERIPGSSYMALPFFESEHLPLSEVSLSSELICCLFVMSSEGGKHCTKVIRHTSPSFTA